MAVKVDLKHMTSVHRATVYEPAEDSYLFVDSLSVDLPSAIAEFPTSSEPLVCLEVGSGSGYVSTHLSLVLRGLQRASFAYCTDINADAAALTSQTFRVNGVFAHEEAVCDLADAFKARLRHRVDVLLFNPPYVPCDADEFAGADGLARAWAGGLHGREVLDRFIPDVGELLSPHGCFYLIAIPQNRPDELMRVFERKHGLVGRVVGRRTAANEQLMLIRFDRRRK
jgi:release factor glutamine methyltransferase